MNQAELPDRDIFFRDHPMPSLLFEWDDGAVIDGNRAIRAVLGYTDEHLFEGRVYEIWNGRGLPDRGGKEIVDITQKDGAVNRYFAITREAKIDGRTIGIVDFILANESQPDAGESTLATIEERNLRLSETLLFGRLGSAELDLTSGWLEVSREFLHLLELPAQQSSHFLIGEFLKAHVAHDDIPLIENVIRENSAVRSGKEIVQLGFQMITARGNRLQVEVRGTFVRGRAFGIVQDVTERWNAQKGRETQAQTIENIINGITDGFYALDKDWNLLLANPAFFEWTGKSKDIIGSNFWKTFPAAAESELYERFHRARNNNLPQSFQRRAILFPDKTVDVRIYPFGEGLILFFKDITEQRKVQDELEKLALVAARTHSAVIFTDVDGRIEWVNEGFERLTGYHLAEVKGRTPGSFLQGPDTDPEAIQYMRNCRLGLKEFQTEVLNYTKSGQPYWIDIDAIPIHDRDGSVKGFMAVQSNITRLKHALHTSLNEGLERHKALLALEKSETDLRAILNASTDSIVMMDRDFKILMLNSAAERNSQFVYGQSFQRGRSILDYVHEQNQENFKYHFDKALSRKRSGYEVKLPITKGHLWLRITMHPVVDSHDEIIGIVLNGADITARREAEELLRITSERLKLATNSAGLGVYEWNLKEDRSIWEEKVYTILGIDLSSEACYRSWLSVVHEEDRDKFARRLERSKARMTTREEEYRIIRPDGHLRYVRDVFVIEAGKSEHKITGVIFDVTDQKLYERSLQNREQQLQVALKEKEILLKEIHHRVKNNLQLISSLVYLRSLSLEQSEFKSFLDNIRNKIRSLALVHERLLQNQSINQVLISDYLGALLSEIQIYNERPDLEINVRWEIEEMMLPLEITIYCALIVNELVTNSIKHAFQDRDVGEIVVSFGREEKQYTLVVSDNGCGLHPDIKPDLTNSFGLQILRVFVKQINGNFTVDREVGTTFKICF